VALMHTHSKYSDIVSGMQKPGDVLRITGEQMINCIEDRSTGKVMSYMDELVIPIIQNDPNEATFVVRI
jgi:methylthioribulose-1-phosphate dehydratase